MFIHRVLPAVAAIASLAACSTSSPPRPAEFNAPPVKVSMAESNAWWKATPASMIAARRAAGPGGPDCRRVVLAYTIDSTGRVFDVEIVDAWPDEAAVRDFVEMRSGYRYEPGAENPERTPVRTVGTHTSFRRGAECDIPKLDGDPRSDRDSS